MQNSTSNPVSVAINGAVALVSIDNPPVNAASMAVRQGLQDAVTATDADPSVKAVVLYCKGRTFVAGADIREFNKPPMEPHLPDVILSMEKAKKPWVAAIHGTALGGGLELAMGCHARVALSSAKLGMPEVNLGLIPGAGGTVRLPRLVEAGLAMQMVAGGKPITAPQALDAGLLDQVVEIEIAVNAAADLEAAAIEFANNLAEGALPEQQVETLARSVKAPADDEKFAAGKVRLLQRARGQLSVSEAINAVERTLVMSGAEALREERASFFKLKESSQSEALRYIFFAERGTLKDKRYKVTPRPLQTVGIVGGGTMGSGIASACLLSGFKVVLAERDAKAAEAALQRITNTLEQSVKRGLLTEPAREEMLAQFQATENFESLAEANLVIEAVFEQLDVKQAVFEKLDQCMPPDAILATNTSYLDVNLIADVVKNPSRVIGLHFFSPAHIMKLLEVVVPDKVADDVVATAALFGKRLGKISVLAGVCDGFIGNRIMAKYRREAEFLMEEGAWPWEVDAAMRNFGFPMGIFEMQDLAGLDVIWARRKSLAANRKPSDRYVGVADKLCEAGRYGRKTGAGYYQYESGKAEIDNRVQTLIEEERAGKGITARQFTEAEIMQRILGTMQAEAQAVLADGTARTAEDIDVVLVNGYSFPRWRGGPMYMLES